MVPAELNEWTFVADVASLMNERLPAIEDSPFSRAKVEESGEGTKKRRDLTLYDTAGKVALTGEVKFPERPDGKSPYNEVLITDAHEKANRLGVDYFFTWNLNRFVLWKTFISGVPLRDREYEYYEVLDLRRGAEVLLPRNESRLREFIGDFLKRFGDIIAGRDVVRTRPLDERFINLLEAALENPIHHTLDAILKRWEGEKGFRAELADWMRDVQGWTLSPEEEQENLGRAAKFSCYVLVNKLVFYEALRRSFRGLPAINIKRQVTKGNELREQLEILFRKAIRVTGDYEKVFEGDFGDELPFLSDAAVEGWKELIEELDSFDFTKISYDVIGPIFERLISPEERHRYGHYYTQPNIVDLINSFCIRTDDARVLDPACGGGTFLVRGYARKKWLGGGKKGHLELIDELYGIDISAYAIHLSALNLATRELIADDNYPLVVRRDFFEVQPGARAIPIPHKGKLPVPKVAAIVGNPPYVRQELLGKRYKQKLLGAIHRHDKDVELDGRSDMHVYFWPHAAGFLLPGGYLGLLSSTGWLDVKYGMKLQKFLLERFKILALFESTVEPWFVGARVATVATILQLEPSGKERERSLVRFVQLRVPLAEIIPGGSDEQRFRAADEFRDYVFNTLTNEVRKEWRIRIVPQSELWRAGLRETEPEDDLDGDQD